MEQLYCNSYKRINGYIFDSYFYPDIINYFIIEVMLYTHDFLSTFKAKYYPQIETEPFDELGTITTTLTLTGIDGTKGVILKLLVLDR